MFGFYDTYMKFFGLTITYYGFFVTLGMIMGIFVACKIAKKRGLKSDDILLLACYVIPIAILGARLYFVVFSGQSYSFLEFFQIWNGGLAVLGGVIGGAVAIAIYCLIHKKNFLKVTDVAVVALILGQAIGRIGCYFGGCCYGIEVENDAFKWFPMSVQIGGVWHYATFFYESFCCFVIFGVFLYLINKKIQTTSIMSGLYLVSYGIVRCGLESIRDNHAALFIGSIKVSQLLSGLIIIAGIVMILIALDRKKNPKEQKMDDDKAVKGMLESSQEVDLDVNKSENIETARSLQNKNDLGRKKNKKSDK